MSAQKRQQAYQNLIKQLLQVSGDEARELLLTRQELVDMGLVQTLEQISDELIHQENWHPAHLLKTIAVNLEVALLNPLTEGTPAEALVFLQNLLQVTVSSKGARQIIYPLLEANCNRLDDKFAQFLKDWGEKVIPILYPSQYLSTGTAFWYLADLIQDFPSTDRAINLEIAIVCYEIALKFAPPSTPGWMILLPNLGNMYKQRLRGDRSQNIEIALRCYKDVLALYQHIPLDEKWLIIQHNLGKAYSDRIEGVQYKNQEQAIKCYQNALDFYIRTGKPSDIQWAHIQNDLAIAYRHRVQGDRAFNLEQAIECYRKALELYPQSSTDWGNTQNNIAISYCLRICGNRLENLKLAIKHYENALQVRQRQRFAEKWAATKINLGNAYRNLADNQQPMPKLERDEYLKQALNCYQNALLEVQPETSVEFWFNAKLNLGNAYIVQGKQDKTVKSLNLAINCWEEILQVDGGRLAPKDRAMVQNNLAVAYRELVNDHSEHKTPEECSEIIQRAIQYCRLALQVRTEEALPQEYAETQGNLGRIYKFAKNFPEAYVAFDSAINTVERLRSEVVSGDSIKHQLAERFYGLYESMLDVCLNQALKDTQYYARAVEYVERSKARSLVENVAHNHLLPKVPESVRDKYQQLQRELTEEQYKISLENEESYNTIADRTQLNQLQQRLNDLLITEIQPIDANFGLTQRVQPITYQEITALLGDNHTAIIEWYITSRTFLAFIIVPNSDYPLLWQSSPEDLEDLMVWGTTYWQDYGEGGQLKENLSSHLQRLAEILHIDEILSHVPQNCDRLILIPHRFLHLFPLHVLHQNNEFRLLDRFKAGVSFSPSCQLLQLTQNLQRSAFNELFAIQNPAFSGEHLVFSDVEVGCIKDLFSSFEILSKDGAKKEAISAKNLGSFHCIHFSCHGYFNWEFPMKSALILANAKSNQYFGETDLEKCLTLSEIFGLSLDNCRLVTLSACETGLVDIRSFVDEYIGLPNGFLVAGSPNVVSSLWKVSDASTCFLMVKFYENLIENNGLKQGGVVIALNQAQKWLRDLTVEELEIFIEEHKTQIEQTFAQLRGSLKGRFEENLKQIKQRQPLPFASPYYWAAFIATGH